MVLLVHHLHREVVEQVVLLVRHSHQEQVEVVEHQEQMV